MRSARPAAWSRSRFLLSQVYKYDYDGRKLKQVNPSTVYRDRLAQQSGVTAREVLREHLLRTFLLQQLDERNMVSMKEIATFCRAYSRDPNETTARLGFDREKLLRGEA